MASFGYEYIVCECNKVTLGEIIYTIKEQGAKNIEDVSSLTDATTLCGCCKSINDDFGNPKLKLYVDEILKRFLAEDDNKSEFIQKKRN